MNVPSCEEGLDLFCKAGHAMPYCPPLDLGGIVFYDLTGRHEKCADCEDVVKDNLGKAKRKLFTVADAIWQRELDTLPSAELVKATAEVYSALLDYKADIAKTIALDLSGLDTILARQKEMVEAQQMMHRGKDARFTTMPDERMAGLLKEELANLDAWR